MTKKMEAAANLLFGKDEVMGVNSLLHVDESSRTYRFFAKVAATLQVSVEVEENSKHKAKSVAERILHDLSDYLQLGMEEMIIKQLNPVFNNAPVLVYKKDVAIQPLSSDWADTVLKRDLVKVDKQAFKEQMQQVIADTPSLLGLWLYQRGRYQPLLA